MNWKLTCVAFGTALMAMAGSSAAEGVLNIFNWGDYTSPELIKKFEAKYNIKVTITDYDLNDTALAKVRAGGHDFDIVVPTSNFLQIWIREGLLLETRPDQMENFKNIEAKWADVPFDPGRHYTAPWLWGSTTVFTNKSVYGGDVNTSAIFLDPPAELVGKINVAPEMGDVMALSIMYMGGEPCSGDKDLLKKVRDKLVEAKPKWLGMDYGTVEAISKGDYNGGVSFSGTLFRARLQNGQIVMGYPKEGFVTWMDSVVVLKDAKNVENAKLFQNFVMDPENAAMISSFARYANAIKGSEAFMPEDMKTAPEIVVPAEFIDKGRFILACPPEVTALYTKIWTELLK